MGTADSPQVPHRTWSIQVQMHHGRPLLTCAQCGPLPHTDEYAIIRSAVLAHLADHARREQLALHLRTCRCGAQGCIWHPRHRGCAGPVSLTLTRTARGRIWRLADACLSCAAATEHAATVPEPADETSPAGPGAQSAQSGEEDPPPGGLVLGLEDEYTWWDPQDVEEHESSR